MLVMELSKLGNTESPSLVPAKNIWVGYLHAVCDAYDRMSAVTELPANGLCATLYNSCSQQPIHRANRRAYTHQHPTKSSDHAKATEDDHQSCQQHAQVQERRQRAPQQHHRLDPE